MSCVSLETQTLSTLSAGIWNGLIVKFNIKVPLYKFNESLKQ